MSLTSGGPTVSPHPWPNCPPRALSPNRATHAGAMAIDLLASDPRGTVGATFDRSLYLRTDRGHWICVGRGLPLGPLNVGVDALAWTQRLQGTPRGTRWALNGQTIALPQTSIALDATHAWHPPSAFDATARVDIATVRRRLTRLHGTSPRTPLLRSVVAQDVLGPPRWYHQARAGLDALRSWRRQGADPEPVARGLLGLGDGLTPSGDDVLVGALVALHAHCQVDAARALERAIERWGPSQTHELSLAHLRAAYRGAASEPLHRVLAALVRPTPPSDVARAFQSLQCIGASSGEDALAGALIVLNPCQANEATT
ncbi:MAG: DUF2877 domain-containing protein [Pseudomonadota bacterium]